MAVIVCSGWLRVDVGGVVEDSLGERLEWLLYSTERGHSSQQVKGQSRDAHSAFTMSQHCAASMLLSAIAFDVDKCLVK